MIRETFANVLRDRGIGFTREFDAFQIDDKQLYVRPIRPDHRHFRFDAFIAMEKGRALEAVSSCLMLDEETGSDPAQRACEEWSKACLEPLRRTITYGTEPDTSFNLYVDRQGEDTDRQVLFDAYSGPCLAYGEKHGAWTRRFLHSPIDWLIANGTLRVPDRPFNMLRIGKRTDEAGTETGLCMINQRTWEEADEILASLDWPGFGEQQFLNFVVLRRLLAGKS